MAKLYDDYKAGVDMHHVLGVTLDEQERAEFVSQTNVCVYVVETEVGKMVGELFKRPLRRYSKTMDVNFG